FSMLEEVSVVRQLFDVGFRIVTKASRLCSTKHLNELDTRRSPYCRGASFISQAKNADPLSGQLAQRTFKFNQNLFEGAFVDPQDAVQKVRRVSPLRGKFS